MNPSENIVVKVENAGNLHRLLVLHCFMPFQGNVENAGNLHRLLVLHCFMPFQGNVIRATFMLLSANTFN